MFVGKNPVINRDNIGLESVTALLQQYENDQKTGILNLFQKTPESVASGLISVYGLLLVSEPPNMEDCIPNTVYIHTDAAGKSNYYLLEPPQEGFVSGPLNLSDSSLSPELKEKLSSGSKKQGVEDIAHREAIFGALRATGNFSAEMRKTAEQQNRFLQMMQEVQDVYDAQMVSGVNPSCYFFSNYARTLSQIYADYKGKSEDEVNPAQMNQFFNSMFSEDVEHMAKLGKTGYYSWIKTYALFTTAYLATAIISLAAPENAVTNALSNSDLVHGKSAVRYNLYSVLFGGTTMSLYQQGEKSAAVLRGLTTSAQVTASSVLYTLTYASLVTLPKVIVSGVLGVSGLVAMAVPLALELYSEYKCTKGIKSINNKITSLEQERNVLVEELVGSTKAIDSTSVSKIAALITDSHEKQGLNTAINKIDTQILSLKKHRAIEEVNLNQHQYNRNTWLAYGAVMGTVSVGSMFGVSLSTLVGAAAIAGLVGGSVATFGALPAAMVLGAGLMFLGAHLRGRYAEKSQVEAKEAVRDVELGIEKNKSQSQYASFFKSAASLFGRAPVERETKAENTAEANSAFTVEEERSAMYSRPSI